MVSPAVSELRHPSRDRLWPVGKQRADLPNVRGAREPGDCSSSGRLGPEGRTRMALLASPEVSPEAIAARFGSAQVDGKIQAHVIAVSQ